MTMNPMPESHKPVFESFASWRAHNKAIAAFLNLPARMLSQGKLAPEALSELIAGAAHPNPKVRWACAHLMDHVADDRCLAALRQLTTDPVPRVRAEAFHALGCARCKPGALQADAVALLVEAALTDPIAKVRGTAVATLGFLPPDARAAEALERIARNDVDQAVRECARRTLKYHASA